MSIAENIAAVRQQMNQAARETGRTGADIILVGASKMNDAAACQEAIAAALSPQRSLPSGPGRFITPARWPRRPWAGLWPARP